MRAFLVSVRRRPRALLRRWGGRRAGGHLRHRSVGELGVVAIVALAAGIAVEFFFDPRSGKRRRRLIRDRTVGAYRRRVRAVERHAHYEAGKVVGLAQAIAHRNRTAGELDDIGLVCKVQSELFRDRTIPKGQISINADRGIVVLRGALDDAQQSQRIERAVRKIAGVRDVENLLHPAHLPAPASHPHGDSRAAHPRA